MAKQCGPATFLGTYMDIIGYADDDRALVRMNGVMNKEKWKRHPSFERTREAARYFGAASVIAAGIWGNLPRGLKWIMEGGAYGRLVAACRGLVGEDGNLSDPEGLVGVDLNFGSLPEILGGGDLMRVERGEMRVSGAAGVDERSRMKDESARAGGGFDESPSTRLRQAQPMSSGTGMKDESRSLLIGRKRKYVMAEPFTDHEDPDFVVEHERLGTIEAFREGLAELRAAEALRALEGRPVVRRRRTWVAACEIGTVELVLGYGKKGKFFLEQRGRHWLGKAAYCSPWVVDHCTADFDESGEMAFEDLRRQDESYAIREAGVFDESGEMAFEDLRRQDESYAIREAGVFDESGKRAFEKASTSSARRLRRQDESGLGEQIREVVREAALSSEGCEKRTGWFVVIVGTEVAEKRGRHWVRMPYCCGARVASVEQDCSLLGHSEGVPCFLRDRHDVLGSCEWRSTDSETPLLELEEIQDIAGEGKDVAADDLRLESELPVPIQSDRVDLACNGACSEYKVGKPGDWRHFEHEGLILDLRARLPAWENRPRFAVRNCHAIRAG